MANDTTGPVWVLDTAATVSTGVIRVERIAWKNATTLNHTAKVTDLDGKVIFEDFASGATYNTSEPIHREVKGFIVETLGSGKLYVSIAQRPVSF
jgi:L-asparaginase/Glu-tRNA(Gln) amidotransferase subunit D